MRLRLLKASRECKRAQTLPGVQDIRLIVIWTTNGHGLAKYVNFPRTTLMPCQMISSNAYSTIYTGPSSGIKSFIKWLIFESVSWRFRLDS